VGQHDGIQQASAASPACLLSRETALAAKYLSFIGYFSFTALLAAR